MASDQKHPLRDNPLWKLLSDISTADTTFKILRLAFTFLVTTSSQWWPLMPRYAINPIGAVAAAGTVFFSTLFVTGGAIQLTRWSVPRIKKWWNPPSLVVIPFAGEGFAAVEITHSGDAIAWEAYIRIAKTLANFPNPDPLVRECCFVQGSALPKSVRLRDGEKASIVFAAINHNEFHGGSWMSIRSADNYNGTRIPDTGAIVEIEIRSGPPIRLESIRRCYKITRPNPYTHMVVEDVPCNVVNL